MPLYSKATDSEARLVRAVHETLYFTLEFFHLIHTLASRYIHCTRTRFRLPYKPLTSPPSGVRSARPMAVTRSPLRQAQPSILDTVRERAVHQEISPSDKSGNRTSKENRRSRHLLGRCHSSRFIEAHCLLEELRHVLLDLVPHTTFEVGVSRRN